MFFLKKSILILLACCLCANLAARTSRIDSLENVLATVKLDNQEKADLLLILSGLDINMDSAKFNA